ncbi:MAG: aminoglycoside phosphotransferase family protein [Desulfobulbus sp.]|nr:aminoglycoside phosphotransferase family protein [Desulfobulbus sp.]
METAAALHFFFPHTEVMSVTPLGKGNINETLRVTLRDGESWVLQRLHPGVFADSDAVMANIRLVTAHLQREPAESIRFFRLGSNPQGQDQFFDVEGCCWRLLSYIGESRTIEQVENVAQAEAVGRLLGRFHCLTASLAPAHLADPLPGFHITPHYLHQYDTLRQKSVQMGLREQQCAEMIEQMRPLAQLLEDARDRLSQRVIHGDPKVGNFLFDQYSDQAVSLIDLDTVKPGLLLHDLGDCLRSCCNPLGEGHEQPEATTFVPELFAALMTGYLGQAEDILTGADREFLVRSAAVISFELGLRFFTDHLAGNRYFRVERQGQNLHRARIQLQLSRSILGQQGQLERCLQSLLS